MTLGKAAYISGMKHDDLRSLGHNIAASMAGGIGLMIGVYEILIFEEAAKSAEGAMTVDFLNGVIYGGLPSRDLARTVHLYREALPKLCAKHGIPLAEIAELSARYSSSRSGPLFVVTVADRSGRRTSTEYAGYDGHRVRVQDGEGRIRPKPVQRT